jgi:hypothetical protein
LPIGGVTVTIRAVGFDMSGYKTVLNLVGDDQPLEISL